MSMVQDLVQSVRSRYDARKKSQVKTFMQLVRDIAAGRNADPDGTIAVLEASEKTAHELAASVEIVQQRMAWQRQIVERETALKNVEVAEKEIRDLSAELDAFRAKLQPKIDAAFAKRSAALAKADACLGATQKLRDTFLDSDLLDREKALTARAIELQACKSELGGHYAGAIRGLAADELRQKIADLDARLAEIECERNDLESKKLVP